MGEKCCATVYPKDRWGSFHGHRCTRNATVFIFGKWYCRQHDPNEIERRNNESMIKYKEKSEQRKFEELERARTLLEPEIKELQFALLDLLDGKSQWYEIQESTGLSEELSKRINILYCKTLVDVQDAWIYERSKK